MKNRRERLPIIVDLLTHKMIGTQEELLSELKLLGYSITQATLSRDLKQLKISKAPNGRGGYRYVFQPQDEDEFHLHTFGVSLPARPVVKLIDRSSNIIVIKSPANHAKFISSAFEVLDDSRILASISVADTVMLVLAPNVDGREVYDILTSVIGEDIVSPYRSALAIS